MSVINPGIYIKGIQTDNLIKIVHALDNLNEPLHQRFEGDCEELDAFVDKLGWSPSLVNKILAGSLVMRELLGRKGV